MFEIKKEFEKKGKKKRTEEVKYETFCLKRRKKKARCIKKEE